MLSCCAIQDRQKRAIVHPQAMAKPTASTTTLWVNGLSTDTKAADLKMLFVKHGKVRLCVRPVRLFSLRNINNYS